MPLYHGDCFDHLCTLQPASVQLLLTDPPYELKGTNNRHTMGRQGPTFGEWDVADHGWISRARPALAPGCNIVIFHDVWKLGDVKAELEAVGAKVMRDLVWLKRNPNPGNKERSFTQTLEHAVWATIPGRPWTFHRNPTRGYETGVFYSSVPRFKIEVRHPTQKPIPVLCGLMEVLSNPGDHVLDPFGGVGSTALAAHEIGREWTLIEQRDDYFAEAQARLKAVGALAEPTLDPVLEGFI
jgi:site-specific DNA-methyltransferase (adenine-specific)